VSGSRRFGGSREARPVSQLKRCKSNREVVSTLICWVALVSLLAARPVRAQLSTEPQVPGSLGVNIHFVDPAPGEMAMLAASGVRWVRMDLDWSATERVKGEYDFSAYDRLVAALDRYHLHAMFILDYRNPLYDNGLSPASTEAIQAFAGWAADAVTHFRGHGILWEMYNEPNWFWTPRPNTEAYIKLALATGEAVHQAAPGEQLIGPASAVIDPPFLEACFRAGLLNYWSAVSIHPYRNQDPETAADDLREVRLLIRKYAPRGKNIPVLAGEWGYSALWPEMDEEKQAAMLAREWFTALANDVPLVVWYDWRDGASASDPEAHFGMVGLPESASGAAGGVTNPVFHPKPAFLAAQTLTRFLNGFRFNKRLALESPDDYLLLFTKGEEVRLAAWTTGQPHKALVPASPGQFELTSMTGEMLAPSKTERHGLSLTLTQSPTYLLPTAPNSLLSIAAAWQRLPLELVIRAPGVLPLHLTVKNSTSDSVKMAARIVEDSQEWENSATSGLPSEWGAHDLWEWKAGPPQKASPGSKVTLVLRVSGAVRSVKPLPLRVELEAGKLGTVAQTTWIVASNPLRLTLLPATGSGLPIAVGNPAGDPVQGWIEANGAKGLAFKESREYVDIKSGANDTIVGLPLAHQPEGEYTLGAFIVDDDGRVVCNAAPSRFHPIGDFSRYTAGTLGSEYKLIEEGAAEPADNTIELGLPVGTPPQPGMSAAKLSFRLPDEHSRVRLVPPAALIAIPGDANDEPKALGLWLYGDDSGVLPFIRFTDSTGQTFQDGGGPINWKGWRYVLVHLASTGNNHSGGANDGAIHYPIHWDSLFMLANPPGRRAAGTIYLASLTLIYGPAGE